MLLLFGLATPLMVTGTVYANGGYSWSGAVCVSTGQVSGKCPGYEWSYNGQTKNPSTGYYYYRNCTDYVAWKLINGGIALSKVSGLGNAGLWDDNAKSKGFSVSTTPRVGTVGVDERYGHVVFVEGVSGSTLTISEYNWGSTGSYGSRSGTASQLGLSKFINFGVSTSTTSTSPSYNSYAAGSGVKTARFLGTDRLSPGQKMGGDQYIASNNVRHVLIMQPDGNLVQYGDGFKVIWDSNTHDNPGAYAVFQTDGNLVVYSKDGRALWNSRPRAGANRLILQHDGNLVTYNSSGSPLWATNIVVPDNSTFIGTDRLLSGAQLKATQYVRSADKRYILIMQTDGNLVAYAPGWRAIWDSNTYGNTGARATYQGDGNMVVYSSTGKPLWYIGTQSLPSHFVIQGDGNIVAYDLTGDYYWASWTNGDL